MRLSEKEMRLLAAIEFAADVPLAVVSRRAGLAKHSAFYYLNKFRTTGVIRRRPMFNPSAIGLQNYVLLLSLPSEHCEAATTFAADHYAVAEMVRTKGAYDVAITLSVLNLSDVYRFLQGLTKEAGVHVQKKSISLVLEEQFFARSYLAEKVGAGVRKSIQFRFDESPRVF
ncbi:MAG: Lrp/AsnC family transcriptional regulator, partial [Bdellovibrionales bacterium]|nr:Lrp/AsnC family transcriptional regulator [Bdellovibrionales bacterium]